jgi:hypothetical protein
MSNNITEYHDFTLFKITNALFTTMIFFIVVLVGIMFLYTYDEYNGVTVGHIISSKCTPIEVGDKIAYSCDMQIKYNIKRTEYTTNIIIVGYTLFIADTDVELNYDIKNPRNIRVKQWSTSSIGMIHILTALVVILIVWLTII